MSYEELVLGIPQIDDWMHPKILKALPVLIQEWVNLRTQVSKILHIF